MLQHAIAKSHCVPPFITVVIHVQNGSRYQNTFHTMR